MLGSTQIDRGPGEKKSCCNPWIREHRAIISLFLSILPSFDNGLIVEHHRASCYLETSSTDLDSSPPCNLAALYHHVSFTFLMPRDITHFILQRCKLRRTHPAPGRNKFACIYVVTASRILRFTQPRILEYLNNRPCSNDRVSPRFSP